VPRPIPGDPWAAANIIADTTAANAQRDLLDALPTPLIVLDEQGDVRYRSFSTHEYFGPEINPKQLGALRDMIRQLDGTPSETPGGPLPEITIHDAGGRVRYMTVAVRRMVFAGDPAHLLSLADVTYIREIEEQLLILNAELQRLATTDALTGVNNRRHFLSAVTTQLQHMRRHRRPAALFILDLDHFKALNDRFGHEVGDHALVQAAGTVHRLMRGHDVFARIGGEEFAGFLPETDIDSALLAAERLRAAVAELQLRVGTEITGFTCSIGVTVVDADTDTPETAMKRADDGLYAAKHEGRDRVRLC
jgi:diguanylate cyclase (GGDEF)-like protein